MILTAEQKTNEIFDQIKAISDVSFEADERPPYGVLNNHFEWDDVFVDSVLTIGAFAIVTERGGPYIWSIATQPSLRRLGVGRSLLEEIAQHYRQAGRQSIGLTCKTTNPAQTLYFRCGYRVEKVARDYYGPEGDGLYMRKTL
jgi:ribosomal protein S18 acetylase RimI-like enzyme